MPDPDDRPTPRRRKTDHADPYDVRGMGLKEPWRSVAIGGTIAVVSVVMIYLVWRQQVVIDRQEALNERREAAVAAREAAFLQALNNVQGTFSSEVREVRERADRRAQMQAEEVRNLAQEIRASQQQQQTTSAELRRLADSLIRSGTAIEKAVEAIPKPEKKPDPDGPPMSLDKLWQVPRFGLWPAVAPRVMPPPREVVPSPRIIRQPKGVAE